MTPPKGQKPDDLDRVDATSAAEWAMWLEAHHDSAPGAWLRLFRKGTSDATLTYTGAVEVALCFGWIDGQAKKLDDVSRVQRFTPRRKRSNWSKVNVERAERLVGDGRMRPAGLREIEAAKKDGRWQRAYDPPSTATVPDDFLRELRKHPKAAAFYETLNKANRFPIAYRLQTAKTPATRARRIEAIIAQFERGEMFHE
jgi:uncharacterized protein YdeI (YjbR/CyaY-like superfamily)